ncbi:MAG: dUTP diphosphatase [Abditibacteriales bacterium]|nr:dUTP diphosphatase [Abditibacteriales bacterium]MDW8365072.1 dUTP diphosphatase [Abditibacteriales bacterium]
MSDGGLEATRMFTMAEELADRVWGIVMAWDGFCKDSVGKQLIRAADSIGANIAESVGRFHPKDVLNFLSHARGSMQATKFWLRRAHQRNLISDAEFKELWDMLEQQGRTLNDYISLRREWLRSARHEREDRILRESTASYVASNDDAFDPEPSNYPLSLLIQRLPESEGLPLPRYMSAGAAGMDLFAAEDATLAPGETKLVSTGVCIAVPEGYEAQIRPRSGLALNYSITIPNAPGTIDADYRGVVKVILHNLGTSPFHIQRGDRIAQMVIAKVERAAWEEVDELPNTQRGAGGFGHTGI